MRTISFICILSLTLFSCKDDKKLKLPKSDKTSPAAKWIITDSSNSNGVVTREFSGENNEWDISPHTKFTVKFTVEDLDGGVQKVIISGGGLTACTLSMQDDIAEISLPGDTLTLKPGKNNEVQPSATKTATLDLACKRKDGEVFPQVARGPGGTVELQGYGENYHAGRVSSRLIIRTKPI
jgi:hypothetical protein